MASGSISYQVSGTVDSGAKAISGSCTLDVTSASEGTHTATSSYVDLFGPSFTNFITVLFYNTGLYDLSIRVNLLSTTKYYFFTVPPGQVFVLPERYAASSSAVQHTTPTTIGVKSSGGDCTFDYCVIR